MKNIIHKIERVKHYKLWNAIILISIMMLSLFKLDTV